MVIRSYIQKAIISEFGRIGFTFSGWASCNNVNDTYKIAIHYASETAGHSKIGPSSEVPNFNLNQSIIFNSILKAIKNDAEELKKFSDYLQSSLDCFYKTPSNDCRKNYWFSKYSAGRLQSKNLIHNSLATIIHEMGHALGLHHEADRGGPIHFSASREKGSEDGCAISRTNAEYLAGATLYPEKIDCDSVMNYFGQTKAARNNKAPPLLMPLA